ncbi:tetratricopeptide repeat protein [Hugenholtzia roseola]|uniref:tetratricopeptide repeat protein n=1 Tax=Hugenholtzia roseola TaxID=1002 RepID=UPI0004215AF8|nr:tetratricopeptide repeat protein [Hugenholtzia roseola]
MSKFIALFLGRKKTVGLFWIVLSLFFSLSLRAVPDTLFLQQNITKYYQKHQYDSVMPFLWQLEQAKTLSNIGKIDAYLKLGKIKVEHYSQYDSALFYFEKIRPLANLQTKQGRKNIAQAALNSAIAFRMKGDYDKAFAQVLEAEKIAAALEDEELTISVLNTKGILYRYQKEYEKALIYYREGLEKARSYLQNQTDSAKERVGKEWAFHFYNNLALTFKQLGRYDSALVLIEKALELGNEVLPEKALYPHYGNAAMLYKRVGKLKEAQMLLTKAIAIAQKGENTANLGALYINLAHIEMALQEWNQAIAAAEKGKQLALEAQHKEWIKNAYGTLAEAFAGKKDYQNAYFNLAEKLFWVDSLFGIEKTNAVAQMEVRYETEKKEKEISQQQNQILALDLENERKEKVLISGVGLVLLLLAFGLVLYKKQQAKIKNQALAKEKTELQLKNTLLEQEVLEGQLQYQQQLLARKNQELLSFTILLVQKRQALEEVVGQIEKEDIDAKIKKRIQILTHNEQSFSQEWEEFQRRFEQVYTDFFPRLKRQFPALTPNELRLCALLRLNLSTKEMAVLLNILPDSVNMSRYRLRKKFELNTDENLIDFIMSL